MASDSSAQGLAQDLSNCSNLSIDKKRKLVYEISKWSQGASEVLQAWSRQEILQILCVEMGKERKYTGLTKVKIIEHLLKVVSENQSGGNEVVADLKPQSSTASGQRITKRQRKTENPSRVSVLENSSPINISGSELANTKFCKNSACRATLNQEDAFCKRCSCCICYQYDDNKDPSLWLVCSSDPPFQGKSCGMSCHLDCAFKHERSGIGKEGRRMGLDGSFYCVSCGKVNDLLGSWRKQLVIAKDTRRVDILRYRVSLSHKLLKGTVNYQKLHKIVDEAVKKLEAELGLLTGLPNKTGRGIVNRLSSGPEVQRLCAFAVESLDSLVSNATFHPLPKPEIQGLDLIDPDMIRFEDIHSTSLNVMLGSVDPTPESLVGYRLWHCKAQDMNYPAEPTCTLLPPKTKFIVTGLTPATEYCFKVSSFDKSRHLGMCEVRISTSTAGNEAPNCSVTERSQSPATNYSGLSNPSSVEDETNNITPYSDQADNRADTYRNQCEDTEKSTSANLSNGAITCNSIGRGPTEANTVSLLDEEHVASISNSDVLKSECKQSPECQIIEDTSTGNGSNSPVRTGMECVPFVNSSEACLPITPCKLETLKDGLGRNIRSNSSSKDLKNGAGKGEEPQDGSTSKKRSGDRQDEKCVANDVSDRDFEYYVKVIRWLECEGHIEQNFRQKFLTWYSLRATTQEVRIVKVFVDTFIEDPASLAGQLIDTFSESISSKKSSVVPSGFCMKLWH
ncbi:PREDICTED: VIN3-like protein 2 [Fragaria vesca subsp. vesca]|uniref:VIN3-like protein 2 n=1 Tax=Fragaria vesca subsp. vesca TaxID=101020 RepID=UPI0002C33B06|nr:PREDICTED: VIN3-like protein 2 [Fragaria vesca subsp. vesca]